MKILELNGIRRAYQRNVDVLRGVDLSLEPGEVVGLLGKNGVGKTTLLRIAMGLLRPGTGSVRVFGLEHGASSVDIKRRTGYVSEDQNLPTFMRVDDVLAMHRELYPTWDADLERKLMRRFDVTKRARIARLSKGQARQVAVLCAVAHRPELLLLDEPAGGLDPATRRQFLEVAIEALHESGSTILFSSHYMQDVERIAGRVVLLHGGEVVIDGELDELREELSLVVLTPHGPDTVTTLEGTEGCVAAREHAGEVRAVFARSPQDVREALCDHVELAGASYGKLGLEDLFIETVEGRS